MDVLSWSLRLFRFDGITVRAHWSLLIIVVYDLVLYLGRYRMPWWMGFALVAIVFLSLLLHEFGHAYAARRLGGSCRVIVMWMMGGLAECQTPMRPWPQFATSAAGPLVSGGLAAIGWGGQLLLRDATSTAGMIGAVLLGYVGLVNLRLLLFNLLPCYPLDGGRMLIAGLWPLVGLGRAIRATLITSYPICIGLAVWALWADQSLVFALALWLTFTLVQEHQRMRQGGGGAFGIDLGYASGRSSGGWLAGWRARRRLRASERRQREEDEEQVILDRLLAKVSELGLPSLTPEERSSLERISRRQRARAEAERV